MDRRTYLACVGVTAIGTAGCLGGDGGDSGPKAAVRRYIQAIDDTNVRQYNSVIHPNGRIDRQSPSEIDRLEPFEYSVENVEIVERTEQNATIRLEYFVEGSGASETVESKVELRTRDEKWKVYREVQTREFS